MRSSTEKSAEDPLPEPGSSEPLLISVSELAKMLSISPRSVWRRLAAGELVEPVRLGHAVRWRRSDVLRWVELGCPAVSTSSDERN